MTTRFADHLLEGATHAERPLASAVPVGSLYACGEHGLIYQGDGAAWSTWATLGSTAPPGLDAEGVRDTVVAMLVQGTNVTLTEDDVANTLTIDAAGGGGSSPWVAALAADPMADLTGWEVKAGTWTAGGAFGVLGSGAAVGDYLTFETDLPQSAIGMEAILRFESLSTASGWHGSGFAFWANDAVLAAGTLQVLYRTDGSVIVDPNNSSSSTPALPAGTLPAVAANTDIRFGAVLRGNTLDLYTGGVYRASAPVAIPAAASVRRRTGLVTRAKNTHFRDVSIWTPAPPW